MATTATTDLDEILVVCDDQDLQQALCETCARLGLPTATADSARKALAMLERHSISAMLIDADLSVTGGYELARAVRGHPRGGRLLLVLLVTGRWSPIQKRAAVQQIGQIEIVAKPVAPGTLDDLLNRQVAATQPDGAPKATSAAPDPFADDEVVTAPAAGPPTKTLREANAPQADPPQADEPLADRASHAELAQVENDTREAQAETVGLRGNLHETPFPALLHQLYGDRATGALFLLKDNVKKIIYFEEGHPVFVKSNLLCECLGKVLVRERLITESDCEESLRRMRRTRRQQGTVLVEMGVISPQNLVVGLELQLQTKLLDIFSWSRGEFLLKVDARLPSEVIQLPMSNASLIAEGIRRCWDDERLRAQLAPMLDHYLAPAADPQLRFQELMLDEVEQAMRDEVDGRQTLRGLLATTPLPDPRARALAYILIATGVVETHETQPPAAEDPLELAMPDDEVAVREQLAADLHALRRRGDPFAVLGVSPSASEAEVERAYSALARQSHPDRFRRYSSATRELARDLFGVLYDAYQQLASPELREHHRDQVTGVGGPRGVGDKPQPAGERLVQRVRRLVDSERWEEARGELTAAIEAHGDTAELRAMLGLATYHSAAGDARAHREAIAHLRRAIELQPRHDRAYLYLGRVYAQMGKRILAEKQFEKALQCNPTSEEALKELRIQQELRPPRRRGWSHD